MQTDTVTQLTHDIGSGSLLDSVSFLNLSDIRSAAANFNDIARSWGLRVALCADIASGKPIMDADGNSLNADIFGWVQNRHRWWADARYALHSPIPRACRYEGEPFWCARSSGFHTRSPNLFLDDIDLGPYFEMVEKVYQAMIVVPVHLPFGQISANSFPLIDREATSAADIFEDHGTQLAALTRRFITCYLSVASKSRYISSDCGLSKREAECIKWASIGKTDDEIGEIMSVCRSTVRYHIRRAGEKLGAVNRTQTVFKAAQLGYLSAAQWERMSSEA